MAENIKHFVRIRNTDLEGKKPILQALTKIYGISIILSNAICYKANIPKNKITGILLPEEIKRIEELIINPVELPYWLYNRRKDLDTGRDMHLTSADLKLTLEFDLKRMKKIKSYKGVRHSQRQPVRGQRTRSHFRKGKSMGVSKAKKVGK